jgi:hypothetical protein
MGAKKEISFCLRHRVQTGSGVQPASFPMDMSPGVKLQELEADHWPPSSVDVNNAFSYTSTPAYVFMAWYLVKYRDNFTFTEEIIEWLETYSV